MNINEYLDTFFKGTKDPSLDAMEYFMKVFNHPEKELKIIEKDTERDNFMSSYEAVEYGLIDKVMESR